MKKLKLYRIIALMLVFVITSTNINMTIFAAKQAKENEEVSYEVNQVYLDETNETKITITAKEEQENVTIQSIELPDGNTVEGKTADYISEEKGSLDFVIHYEVSTIEESTTEESTTEESVTEEVTTAGAVSLPTILPEKENVTTVSKTLAITVDPVEAVAAADVSIGEKFTVGVFNYEVIADNEVSLLGDDGSTVHLNLDTVMYQGNEYKVTKVGPSAFGSHLNLQSVKMKYVKEVDRAGFYFCLKLETVELPEVEVVREYGFGENGNYESRGGHLRSVNAPNLKVIEKDAFRVATELESITLSNVETIGYDAFRHCESLTITEELTQLTVLAENALVGCIKLTSLSMPKLSQMNNSTFNNNIALKELHFLDQVPVVTGNPFTGSFVPERKLYTTNPEAFKKDFRDGNVSDNMWFGWEITKVAPPEVLINEQFPDENFRKAIIETILNNRPDPKLGDSDLSDIYESDLEVIGKARMLYCDNRGIKSIEGIANFKSLIFLKCQENQIETIDISGNLNITTFDASSNGMKEIVVGEKRRMTLFSANDNSLTTLDLSQVEHIYELNISKNKFETLDISHLERLGEFDVSDNQLMTIDMSQNTELISIKLFGNHLSALDLSIYTGLNNYTSHVSGQTRELEVKVEDEKYVVDFSELEGIEKDDQRIYSYSDTTTEGTGTKRSWDSKEDIPTTISYWYQTNVPNLTEPKVKYMIVEVTLDVSGTPDIKKEHKVTVAKEVPDGMVSLSQTSAKEGDIVKVTVTAKEGYEIVEGSLKANGVVINEGQFVMPDMAVEVTVEFNKTHKVTVAKEVPDEWLA